jgi:hypothetical protein
MTLHEAVNLISHWLARHVGDSELREGLRGLETAGLDAGVAELVDELRAELERGVARGELEMVARETLEALALS